jgi:hypothetical protein
MRILPAALALSVALLSGCTPPPPVEQSRAQVWQRFAHHSIDDVMLAWGPPSAESKLTNGSRMLTYRRGVTYDAGSSYASTNGCEATFLAPPPHFKVENVAMTGNGFQCADLARAGPGFTAHPYVPPPPPPGFYPGIYFYR